MSNAIFVVRGYFKISLRFWLEKQKDNITNSNISLLDCDTLPSSKSNDDDEINTNTYRQLKDIIALHENNKITKYNLVKETKSFSEEGKEIIYSTKKDVWVEVKISVLVILTCFI